MKSGDIVFVRFPQAESSIISNRLGNILLDRLKRIKTRLIDWISTQLQNISDRFVIV
jgi:hypothetical protein